MVPSKVAQMEEWMETEKDGSWVAEKVGLMVFVTVDKLETKKAVVVVVN